MKVSSLKKKTHFADDGIDPETAAETAGESLKVSSEGGFITEDGGGSGESTFPEMGIDDDKLIEDREEDDFGGEEVEEEEEEEGGAQEEKPKLDEGYFEIEAIRRKRVRKGKIQYLIKWRGWPETANTWEPLENLQSIADVIDAFEGSLRPGKPGRKKKRKYGGGPNSLMKKKQRTTTSHDNATEKSDSSTSLNNDTADLSGSSREKAKEANSGGSVGIVRKVSLVEEYDPTLNELRGPVVNGGGGGGECSEGYNVRPNGLLKVYPKEVVDKESRFIGAKRRKSGSVKRFKQDGTYHTVTSDHDMTTPDLSTFDSFGRIEYLENNNNPSQKSTKMEELVIAKILKPMSFSASVSNNVQDVSVTFLALRSDGKEEIVDNRFLKAHNPLLLIEFYEQHLKYNPSP